MGNCLLCYPNRVPEATLTGGSWGGTLDNVKTRYTSNLATSTDVTTASTSMTVTYPVDRFIKIVSLYNHNLTDQASYRIRLYDGSDVPLYDSGTMEVWPTLYVPDQLEWEYDNFWTCRPSEEDVQYIPKVALHVLDESVFCKKMVIDMDDTGNLTGHVTIGKVIACPKWQPVRNMIYGAALGWEDISTVTQSLGGVEFYSQRPKYRTASFRIDNLSEEDGTNKALGMQGQLGVSGEVFFVFDPDSPTLLHQRSFNGRLRTLSPLEHTALRRTGLNFELKEVI
jgi:hypothetical protein